MDPLQPYCKLNSYQSTSITGAGCSTPALYMSWRALVPSEVGLEYHLQKLPEQFLPEQFVADLLSKNVEGRSAQELGDLKTAMKFFGTCKSLISEDLIKIVPEHVQKQDYDLLLAWANLPLAQLCQSLGTRDPVMFQEAMDMRKEVLDCIMSLKRSDDSLELVCKSYYYTAQYEWGCATSSLEARTEAVQEYAKLLSCNEDQAGSQLCFLLGIDHQYLGNFEVGLQWIQKADRLCPRNTPGVDTYRYVSRITEAELFLQLEKFPEAVEFLQDLICKYPESVYLRRRLEECYSLMKARAEVNGLPKEAKRYEELAKEQHDLHCRRCGSGYIDVVHISKAVDNSNLTLIQGPFDFASVQGLFELKDVLTASEDAYFEIPRSHMMMAPPHCPVGSWLGLVQADDGSLFHELEKWPIAIFDIIQSYDQLAEAAQRRCDWEGAILNYERIRELLKVTTRVVARETYDWLLSWCDLSLANWYHYHTRKFEKALEIWKEMTRSANRILNQKQFLTTGYGLTCMAVLFERQVSKDLNKTDLDMSITDITSERLACFWLYYGYFRSGNYAVALKWLGESAKRHKAEVIRRDVENKCLVDEDYFCCDYDYLRSEADLLMRLQRFSEAKNVLENLLKTRQCIHVQGTHMFTREANAWLQRCNSVVDQEELDLQRALKLSLSGDDQEELDLQRALKLSLSGANYEPKDGIAEQSTSPTGCDIVVGSNDENFIKLVQSQAGLEHHLRQLPVPLHLAFRKHGDRGQSYLEIANWRAAIFEFEWCINILKSTKEPSCAIEAKSRDWLMVWAILPLVGIYEFRTKELKTAVDLLVEMVRIIMQVSDSGELERLKGTSLEILYTARYHYSDSNYPDLKHAIVKEFGAVSKQNTWGSENQLLSRLYRTNVENGNHTAALLCIREARRLFIQHFAGDELALSELLFFYVDKESTCLFELQRPKDAIKVLLEYRDSIGKSDEELPVTVQRKMLELFNTQRARGLGVQELHRHAKINLERAEIDCNLIESGIWQLRLDSLEFEKNGEYAKAIDCYEGKISIAHTGGGLESSFSSELLSYDYQRLGCLHLELFMQTIGSRVLYNREQIVAFYQDVNFIIATQCFEKSIKLSRTLRESAKANSLLATIYGVLDYQYRFYLQYLGDQIPNELKPSVSTSDPHKPLLDYLYAVHAYLNLQTPLQKYGEKAIAQYGSLLSDREGNRDNEGWIELLELHGFLYTLLENYHISRAQCFNRLYEFDGRNEYQKEIDSCQWKAFKCAEAQRAQVMLYQLGGSSRFYYGHSFEDLHVLDDIQGHWATLQVNGPTIFVQYSPTTEDRRSCFLIYVIDQDGNLSVTATKKAWNWEWEKEGETKSTMEGRSLQKRLNDMYSYLEGRIISDPTKPRYNGESLNNDLEFLHDLLIEPIAAILKPGHKLILAPSELLSKVPFAALCDRSKEQKYLIERHAISLTPSLRVLYNRCERLQDLQSSYPYTDHVGSIVALGDPAYECPMHERFKRLEGTGKEVEHIAKLFGETAVLKLLGRDATAQQLLYWAAKASHDCFRQALVHIGAHGTMKDEEKNHREYTTVSLQLACGSSVITQESSVTVTPDDSFWNKEAYICDPGTEGTPVPNTTNDSSWDKEAYSWTKKLLKKVIQAPWNLVSPANGASSSLDTASTLSKRGHLRGKEFEGFDTHEEYVSYCDDDSDKMISSMSMSDCFMESAVQTTPEARSQVASSSSNATIRRSVDSVQKNDPSHALKVDDISSCEWRAELVVLSACQTAKGRVTTEGVLSIARAIMIAGVPCVVASQWKVDDEPTAALMQAFYNELQKGNDVASSLRSAMLDRMRTHRHAVNEWAPFYVFGVPSLRIPRELQLEKKAYPDPAQSDSRQESPNVMNGGQGMTFTLFPVDDELPPHSRLATVQDVINNRQALLSAMPGWQIANLADGSVDGACYGGGTRDERRQDVGHKLATRDPIHAHVLRRERSIRNAGA